MNNIPRQKLIEIIALYGSQVIDTPQRVEGLLRDLCGENRREIAALMDAARERVASELRDSPARQPPELLVASLTQRLLANRPMSDVMALWAVESWAQALGIIIAPSHPATRTPMVPSTHQVGPAMPASNELKLALATGVEMVFRRVPAGEFFYGEKNGEIYLDEYWIGKYPVTNGQFHIFLHASKYLYYDKLPGGKENHPVVNVSWNDASAFCTWAAKASGLPVRLTAEMEWEKAARGLDGRTYPWGEKEPDGQLCNCNSIYNSTTSVGRFSPKGDSIYGCADLIGNVWEWVEDWYDEHRIITPGIYLPLPIAGTYKVLRGGSWFSHDDYLHATYRNNESPDNCSNNVGFRCSAPP